ncbi:hypothetical protein JX265_003383 [Neoarthrinium moseri]|uniref:F-box domain-containing protein n=1 Tax=Neoarthrinium moseri TaxID=1658444 RepID=A0A9P9WS64_9PEZI|nr:uncharacterized protein JN550_000783 [Neoarthrinium moseri]KAI1850011.1 hypothetical protein JX266_004390 [Neoarthrinium moseri]KAI1876711.1 hypothetical protein JN550_000783 [Neoarthrinium moseri]KAI1877375.1 hypothetical protein JX265_003383 [Neoarthrinium moseri]
MNDPAAWECRDHADLAEEWYNHPLRTRNRVLEDENLMLKRLLREQGIGWPGYRGYSKLIPSSSSPRNPALPGLPVEIILKVLSYAMTSSYPIIDPLCKSKKENRTAIENGRSNQIAIHFLATCKAYHTEGTKHLWSNNRFTFTTVQAVKMFSEVDLRYRQLVREANFRIIAKFYDDDNRVHKLSRDHHPMMTKPIRLRVSKRAREPTLARRGFRSYAWFQLVDFLEALLPPHDPNHDLSQPRTRLLPSLENLRIDLVNFAEDMFQFPPAQLHDIASHHLGCSLNQLIVTGLPRDDTGYRTGSELSGLLKDDGLVIDHAPTFVALPRSGLRALSGNHFHSKVIRSMRPLRGIKHHHHDDHPGYFDEFPPAPSDAGTPPYSEFHSCRTIWKRIPKHIDRPHDCNWVLFDRVSGLRWDDIEDEATMFDCFDEDDDEFGGYMVCENCGQQHPGAIPPEDLMDELYDDY